MKSGKCDQILIMIGAPQIECTRQVWRKTAERIVEKVFSTPFVRNHVILPNAIAYGIVVLRLLPPPTVVELSDCLYVSLSVSKSVC